MKCPEALDALREQKGDDDTDHITAEQKAALEAAGWRDELRGWRKPAVRFAWCGDSHGWQATQSEPFQRIPLSDVLEFAAIMGIASAGHVLVPVEQLAEWAQRLEGTWPNSFTEGDVAEEIRAAIKR